MRHIADDNIVSITADSEDANFLIEMVSDSHPKRIWKTDDNISKAKVTIGVVGGVSDILVAGTNAASASVSVSDPNEMSWGDSDLWGGATSGGDVVSNGGFDSSANWSIGIVGKWAIDAGVATVAVGGFSDNLYQEDILEIGEYYVVIFEITARTAGSVTPYAGSSGTGSPESTVGIHAQVLLCSGTNHLYLVSNSSFVGSVDNVRAVKLTDYDVWANDDVSTTASVTQRAGSNSLWIQLNTPIDIPVDVVLTLIGTGGTSLYAGIIRANIART